MRKNATHGRGTRGIRSHGRLTSAATSVHVVVIANESSNSRTKTSGLDIQKNDAAATADHIQPRGVDMRARVRLSCRAARYNQVRPARRARLPGPLGSWHESRIRARSVGGCGAVVATAADSLEPAPAPDAFTSALQWFVRERGARAAWKDAPACVRVRSPIGGSPAVGVTSFESSIAEAAAATCAASNGVMRRSALPSGTSSAGPSALPS